MNPPRPTRRACFIFGMASFGRCGLGLLPSKHLEDRAHVDQLGSRGRPSVSAPVYLPLSRASRQRQMVVSNSDKSKRARDRMSISSIPTPPLAEALDRATQA